VSNLASLPELQMLQSFQLQGRFAPGPPPEALPLDPRCMGAPPQTL